MRPLLPIFSALSLTLMSHGGESDEAEVVIHIGAPFSLSLDRHLLPTGDEVQDAPVWFQREFRLPIETFKELAFKPHQRPVEDSEATLSAEKALSAAEATLVRGGGPRGLITKELQRLLGPSPDFRRDALAVDFHLICFISNGSEVYRAVLMDGTVLKPTLKKLSK